MRLLIGGMSALPSSPNDITSTYRNINGNHGVRDIRDTKGHILDSEKIRASSLVVS